MRRANIQDALHDASGAARYKMRRENIQDTIQESSGARSFKMRREKYAAYNSGRERGRQIRDEARKIFRMQFIEDTIGLASGAGRFRLRHDIMQMQFRMVPLLALRMS